MIVFMKRDKDEDEKERERLTFVSVLSFGERFLSKVSNGTTNNSSCSQVDRRRATGDRSSYH